MIAIVMLSACTVNKNEEFLTTISIGTIGSDETYNDNGIIVVSRGIAYYIDPATGIKMPICTKINCNHNGRSPANPSPTCNAYLSEYVNCAAFMGNNLYYVSCPDDKGLFIKEFYKANKDGTNRRLLYRAEEAEIYSSGIYEEGYLIYAYYNDESQDGKKLDKNKIGILVLNLENESMKKVEIADRYSGKVLISTIKDGYLYYMLSYYYEDLKDYGYDYLASEEGAEKLREILRLEVWRYNIETEENELIDLYRDDESSYRLGFGHLIKGVEDDKRFEMIELSSGEKNCLYCEEISGMNVVLTEEGVLFTGKGEICIWKYGTDCLEQLGSYDIATGISVYWVTKTWVYGRLYSNGSVKDYCCLREEFMQGILNLKTLNIRE